MTDALDELQILPATEPGSMECQKCGSSTNAIFGEEQWCNACALGDAGDLMALIAMAILDGTDSLRQRSALLYELEKVVYVDE